MPESQLVVCKGITMCGIDIVDVTGVEQVDDDADGKLDVASTPGGRIELIQKAYAEKGLALGMLEYYVASVELLVAVCSGEITATEQVCTSLLPFDDCMARLLELYEDLEEHANKTFSIKRALLLFFLHVGLSAQLAPS